MAKNIQQANLRGVLPPQAERHIRDITTALMEQAETLNAMRRLAQPQATGVNSVTISPTDPKADGTNPATEATKATKATKPTVTTPLNNVTSLPGLLAQPQTPLLQIVTTLPPINSPLSQNGTVIIYSNSLWYFVSPPLPGVWKPVPTLAVELFGTHAQRLTTSAAIYPTGSLYYETDRRITYVSQPVLTVQSWVYSSGTVPSSDPSLADLPADLTSTDDGLTLYSSYFQRVWRWSGSNWHYGDSGPGAGAQLATSGPPPSGGLWQACNGSAVFCALDNATLATLTTSNTAASGGDNPMIEGGPGSSQQPASSLTFTGGAAGTTGVDAGTGTVVQSGTGATVAAHTHTHTTSAAGLVLPPPSESTGGLSLRVSLSWWMRR